jgi:hypothetical protein
MFSADSADLADLSDENFEGADGALSIAGRYLNESSSS